VPYGNDETTKEKMLKEDDLGLIYWVQWRDFSDPHSPESTHVDQLKEILATLTSNPNDRRMICSAWNPSAIDQMALPPCHLLWQVTVINGKLNLAWYQRSVDTPLGLPFNIASYGLLLHLLARHAGLKEGRLIGFLMDTHIYVNQIDAIKEQLTREPRKLPHIETCGPSASILDWDYTATKVAGYNPHSSIKMPIAV
jgi:thymidylate synthase